MNFDYFSISNLKQQNISWKILNAANAPLFFNFLYDGFFSKNRTSASESDLIPILDNILFYKNQEHVVENTNLKNAKDYLTDWSHKDTFWLNKTYPQSSQEAEAYYDIPPHTQKAFDFLASLEQKRFVGSQSKLRSIFNLLKEIDTGSTVDKEALIAELEEQKRLIDEKIERIKVDPNSLKLDDVEIIEKFYELKEQAGQIVSDFRQVEYNFRELNRNIRQTISTFSGTKGQLLDKYMGDTDAIEKSEQGRCVNSFANFLLNSHIKSQFKFLFGKLLNNKALEKEDTNSIRDVFNQWVDGHSQINSTMSLISSSLRSFIDNRIFVENRAIYADICNIQKNIQLLSNNKVNFKDIEFDFEIPIVDIKLAFDRPLYTVEEPVVFNMDDAINASENITDPDAISDLFSTKNISKDVILSNLNSLFISREQITLALYAKEFPIEYGLEELLATLQIATEYFEISYDENIEDVIHYFTQENGVIYEKTATMIRTYIKVKGA